MGELARQGSRLKEFPTAEKARQSYEKLIREKLNKGYVEVSQDLDIAFESQNSKEIPSVVKAPSEIISESLPNQDIVPATLEITRSLDLNPEDWLIATWRPRSPRPRSEPKPFNLEDALKRLRRIQGKTPDRQWQGYADAADEEFDPTNIATVGVVYPLHLSPEIKANWGQTLSDYEIIPPFPQIDRDTYTLQPEEVEVEEIKRFQAVQIPSVTLARMMESRGWLKGVIPQWLR